MKIRLLERLRQAYDNGVQERMLGKSSLASVMALVSMQEKHGARLTMDSQPFQIYEEIRGERDSIPRPNGFLEKIFYRLGNSG